MGWNNPVMALFGGVAAATFGGVGFLFLLLLPVHFVDQATFILHPHCEIRSLEQE